MVSFALYDESELLIRNIDVCDEFPDEIKSIKIKGPFDEDMSGCTSLTAMLESFHRKLEKITVEEFFCEVETPEFLAFVVLLGNKTSFLCLKNCQLSTNAMSCLMATLCNRDGIRSLSFSWFRSQMPTDTVRILLQGVAASHCLESFHILFPRLVNSKDVSMYLIQALHRNRSLKKISIDTRAFAGREFRDIFKASMFEPKLRAVEFYDSSRELPFGVLKDAVCRRDCTLEELKLDGIQISISAGEIIYDEESRVQNSSIRRLAVDDSTLSNEFTLIQMTGLFKSLVHLQLVDSKITDLSFLDALLFDDSSQLISLDIRYNTVGERKMRDFVEELREKGGQKLKYLGIRQEGWDDHYEDIEKALIDVFRPSTNLELNDFLTDDARTDGIITLNLNRGGRRIFEPSSQPFPTNLLPQVLERSSKIKYYFHDGEDEWGRPLCVGVREDVVFWMMKKIVPLL